MARSVIGAVARLGAQHHGVVTTAQLHEAEVSRQQIRTLVSHGVLQRAGRAVFVVATSPDTWERRQQLLVVTGGRSAVVSHRGAARLWGFEGFDSAPAEVSVLRGDRGRAPLGVVHEVSRLERRDLANRTGFRVTSPARTLVDLAGVTRQARLEVALDDALRRGLTTLDRVEHTLDRLRSSGRTGVVRLDDLLCQRGDSAGRAESPLETLLVRVLLDHGLPMPSLQHELYDQGTFVARFDAAYVPERVAIEADSERWHLDRRRFVADRSRRARAEALGWRVLAFTHHHVTNEGAWVAATVRRTREAAA